jgi:hypothetical protein
MVTARGRRRTLGGVFFQLAHEALAPEDRRRLFDEPQERELAKRRQLYLERVARREGQQGSAPANPQAPAQRWTVELVHVASGQSSDAAAPRVLAEARGILGDSTYPTQGEARKAGEQAVRSALSRLYGSRLPHMVVPRIEVRAVPMTPEPEQVR